MDRMRESLFSILGDLSGRSFLDLFSGSGLVGLEAASRGADPVDLVEKDPGKKTGYQGKHPNRRRSGHQTLPYARAEVPPAV